MNPYGRRTSKRCIPHGPEDGLDADDLEEFAEAYEVMARCRVGIPADFVRAVRKFRSLCCGLDVFPGEYERAAMAQRINLDRAIGFIEEQFRRAVA